MADWVRIAFETKANQTSVEDAPDDIPAHHINSWRNSFSMSVRDNEWVVRIDTERMFLMTLSDTGNKRAHVWLCIKKEGAA